MKKIGRSLLAIVIAALLTCPAPAQVTNVVSAQPIRLEVFVRGDSELSAQAAKYASELGDRTLGLEVVIHDVVKDRAQLSRLWKLARQSGRDKPVVPAFYSCNRLYFGFANEQKTGPAIQNLFTADVYTRSTCSRCKAAKAFIARLAPRWQALRFRIYEVSGDASALQRYRELCQSRGQLPGLPTLHFAGEVIIGYQGDHLTGAQYENLIRRVSGAEDPKPKPKPDEKDTSANEIDHHQAIRLVGLWSPREPQSTSEPESEDVPQFDDVPLPDDLDLPEDLDLDLPEELSLPDEAGTTEIGEAASSQQSQSEPPPEVIDVPLLGELRVGELGLPLFTFLVGLVDGFNPCAMWILVFLLSVLVNIKDRRKILLIAGTFVVVSGLAYFAFMAAWLNVFMLIGFARKAQVILGVVAIFIGVINVKDFFAFKKGISLSIPESTKPGLYKRVRKIVSAKYLPAALAGVIALAVIVNMVELLCTAGLPALYTQILTMHELPTWKNYAYLGLYISAYMLDDAVLLTIVVTTLSHRRLQEREGRWLKLLSGLVILALGVVMIVKPEWLQLGH